MTATPAGMTYADYLDLRNLLGAQKPLSALHDEMLFIIIHQTKELWMKEMLHELRLAATLIEGGRFAEAYKAMARLVGSGTERRKRGMSVLDGAHLVAAFLDSGSRPEEVMVNNVNVAIELENLSYFIQD